MREVDPKETKRARAYELWMNAPMPMVTFFKTLDVTNLIKLSRKRGYKFNMLMCYCVLKAAVAMEEFYLLPVGDKLIEYDRLAVTVVVNTKNGGINHCDVPYAEDISEFNRNYLSLTETVSQTDQIHDLSADYAVIGTSAMVHTELDGAVNIYTDLFKNPFMIWSKYRQKFIRTQLKISFQFHHTQMDGGHAAKFLESLQREIRMLKA